MKLERTQFNRKYLIAGCLLISLALNPEIRKAIDKIAFFVLNGHLAWTPRWYNSFFALLNHPWESKLNLTLIIALIMSTYQQGESKIRFFFKVVFYAIIYEFLFQSIHYIVRHNTLLLRASPSCSLPHIDLNQQGFPFPVKTSAHDSFPSGHAISITYWLSVYYYSHPQPRKDIMYAAFLLFTLPRLVGGAHWLSDIYIGMLVSICYFQGGWLVITYCQHQLTHLKLKYDAALNSTKISWITQDYNQRH